ncbi:hypothetical protein [Staphylococcus agnetis]|uniref:hypothetical protein n=1 Tax=Staphylococcus agnetis TaxID=985762 RepID=UPI00118CFFA7|nr:hypothetical protein [Staphylococcus agnetis]QDW99049.1 hypothetical protein DWB91_07860 [Staphylococcus agnetis]
MLLDILGYILGIGFVVFGICAIGFARYEAYKIISKSNKKVSYKKSVYCGVIAIICSLLLIIIANIF